MKGYTPTTLFLTKGKRKLYLGRSTNCPRQCELEWARPGRTECIWEGKDIAASDQHLQGMCTNVTKAVHQGPTKLRLPVDHPLESLGSQSRFKSQKSKSKRFIEVQHLVHQFSHNFRGETGERENVCKWCPLHPTPLLQEVMEQLHLTQAQQPTLRRVSGYSRTDPLDPTSGLGI